MGRRIRLLVAPVWGDFGAPSGSTSVGRSGELASQHGEGLAWGNWDGCMHTDAPGADPGK